MSILEFEDNKIRLMQVLMIAYDSYIEKCHREQHGKIDVPWMAISHGNILMNLMKNDEMTMTQITESINRTAPTTTTLVKKLKREGIVTSRKSKDDSRINLISLTDRGRQHCSLMEGWLKDFYEVAGEGITEEEVETIMRVLNKSLDNMKKVYD